MKFLAFLIGIQLLMISPALGQIDWQPYPGELYQELRNRIKFGYLTVPENRTKVNSRRIKMAFTLIKSSASQPSPDPVVFLPGGPGMGFSPMLQRIYHLELIQKVIESRDIILIDPRGCGFSYPTLCDTINDPDLLKVRTFASKEESLQLEEMMWSECARHLMDEGVNVHTYSSLQIAHDLETLRRALGYEKWNLRGHSYGSYFALVLMQTYPESIRSAFLSGIVTQDYYYDYSQYDTRNSIKGLIETCKNDPLCNANFPLFEEDLKNVLQGLGNEPVAISYLNSKKERISVNITPRLMTSGIRTLLYDKAGIEVIPALIDAIEQGNEWILENTAASLLNSTLFSDDLRHDMLPIIRGNDIPLDPKYRAPEVSSKVLPWLKIEWLPDETEAQQLIWSILRSSDSILRPDWRVLDIPVLLVSGAIDPVTPPYHGEQAQRYLSNASHYVVPGSGHYAHSDAKMDFAAFFENPDPSIPFESIAEPSPIRFVTGVSANKGISSLMSHILNQKYNALYIPLLSICLSLIGFVYFPLTLLIGKIRNKEQKLSYGKTFPIWSVSAMVLVLAALFILAIYDAFRVNPYILSIGLPSNWDFIFHLAVIAVLILEFNLFRLFHRFSKKSLRIPILISLLGGLGFLAYIWIGGLVPTFWG